MDCGETFHSERMTELRRKRESDYCNVEFCVFQTIFQAFKAFSSFFFCFPIGADSWYSVKAQKLLAKIFNPTFCDLKIFSFFNESSYIYACV